MKTFIQLRDNIGYSTVTTTGDLDHSTTPDHTTVVEVFTDNPEQFLKKIYNAETKTWSDAPIIRYAELNEYGDPIEIRRTVFVHEIPNNASILPAEATGEWRLVDGEWLPPIIIVEPAVLELPQPNE